MAESISISIPAFNEEATLEGLVRGSLQVLARHTDDYEVLIIDDGSRDQTGGIADRLSAENSHVRVIHHAQNQGFGITLQETFTRPSKEWVFFIPGDGQIPPEELDTLWPFHSESDFILGWRIHRQDPWKRRLTAWIYNVLISLLMRRRIHDVDSVVLFRRAITRHLTLTARSVFLHAEFCLKATRQGASVREIPITHRPRTSGEARGNNPGVIWQTLREMIAYLIP